MKVIVKRFPGRLGRVWLSHFFRQALSWIGLAWKEATRWLGLPSRKRRCKQGTRSRSFGFVCLVGESLEPRRCLSDLYWGGGSAAFVSQNWYVVGVGVGNPITWTNVDGSGNRNVAHIQGASGTVVVTIGASDNISPAAIFFGGAGSNASYKISGGAINLSQDTEIGVTPGQVERAAQIDSTISGSSYQLVITNVGSLALTGNVTVAGIQELHGTLALNGLTMITNGDNSNPPIGLLVSNDATITGSGRLTLEDQLGQTTLTPFNYDSSSITSYYIAQITGPGHVEVMGGELQLDSAANAYSGGTSIGTTESSAGTLQLTKDPTLHAPVRLGSGPVTVYGTLDLNGQSLTLTSLFGNGTVEDAGSDLQGPLGVGVVRREKGSELFSIGVGSMSRPFALAI